MKTFLVNKCVGDEEIKLSLWASAHGVSPTIFEIDHSKIVWQYLDPIDPKDIDQEKLFNLLLRAVQIGLSHRDAGPLTSNNGADMNVRQDRDGRYYLIDWGEAEDWNTELKVKKVSTGSFRLVGGAIESPSVTPTREQMLLTVKTINTGHNWMRIFNIEGLDKIITAKKKEFPHIQGNKSNKSNNPVAKEERRKQQNEYNEYYEAKILKNKQRKERRNMGAEDPRVQVEFGKPSRFYFGGLRVSVDTAFGLYKGGRKFTLVN